MKYRKLSDRGGSPSAPNALDPGGDYRFGGGKSDWWVDAPEGVAQSVVTRLRLWRGDWWLDLAEGTDFRGRVLGKNTRGVHDLELRARILGSTGVAGLPVYRSAFDGETRRLGVQATVSTIFGPAPLAAAVFVAAPQVPASLIPVPLLGADGVFLFGPGGEDLVVPFAPPDVHDGEAGRIPYGVVLDDDGWLIDGFGSALISALGVMPPAEPIPVEALVDGLGGAIEDGFGSILIGGDGLDVAVPLPPTAAALPLVCAGVAAAGQGADVHRPQLRLGGAAATTQRANAHRPQLAASSAAATTQAALLRKLAFPATASSVARAALAAKRALAAPGAGAASQALMPGRISNPAHVLALPGVAAAGQQSATLHAVRRIAAPASASGVGRAALTGNRHLLAGGGAATSQRVILSI